MGHYAVGAVQSLAKQSLFNRGDVFAKVQAFVRQLIEYRRPRSIEQRSALGGQGLGFVDFFAIIRVINVSLNSIGDLINVASCVFVNLLMSV